MEKSTNNKPKDGLHTEWYDSGQKKEEGTYKNGKRDGLWIYWYNNGQKNFKYSYKKFEYGTGFVDSLKHGPYFRYFIDGKKCIEGNCENGRPVGKWYRYHINGEVERINEYFIESREKYECVIQIFSSNKKKLYEGKLKYYVPHDIENIDVESYFCELTDSEWVSFYISEIKRHGYNLTFKQGTGIPLDDFYFEQLNKYIKNDLNDNFKPMFYSDRTLDNYETSFHHFPSIYELVKTYPLPEIVEKKKK